MWLKYIMCVCVLKIKNVFRGIPASILPFTLLYPTQWKPSASERQTLQTVFKKC